MHGHRAPRIRENYDVTFRTTLNRTLHSIVAPWVPAAAYADDGVLEGPCDSLGSSRTVNDF